MIMGARLGTGRRFEDDDGDLAGGFALVPLVVRPDVVHHLPQWGPLVAACRTRPSGKDLGFDLDVHIRVRSEIAIPRGVFSGPVVGADNNVSIPDMPVDQRGPMQLPSLPAARRQQQREDPFAPFVALDATGFDITTDVRGDPTLWTVNDFFVDLIHDAKLTPESDRTSTSTHS